MNRCGLIQFLKYAESTGAEVQCVMVQTSDASRMIEIEGAVRWFLRPASSGDLIERFDENTLIMLLEMSAANGLKVAESMLQTVQSLENPVEARFALASTKFFVYELDRLQIAAQQMLVEASLYDSNFVCVATPVVSMESTLESSVSNLTVEVIPPAT